MENVSTTQATETTTTADITVDVEDGPVTPFDGRNRGWRASLILNPEDRTVTLYTCIGSGVPAYVWHRRAVQIAVSPAAAGEAVRDVIDANLDKVAEIFDAYEGSEWDGSNHVGTWAEDECGYLGEGAERALSEALEEAATYVSASDWLGPAWTESKAAVADALDAAAPEAALDALADRWAAQGAADGVLVDSADLRDCIDHMVKDLAADEEDEDLDAWLVRREGDKLVASADADQVLPPAANLGENWWLVEARTARSAIRAARQVGGCGPARALARRLLDEAWTWERLAVHLAPVLGGAS